MTVDKFNKKKLRFFISIFVTLVALYVGVRYLAKHRYLLTQLSHTPPKTILTVLGLYILVFGVLLLILFCSLRICDKQLKLQENVLLNAYSLFINFFIPGQGGPAFRGLYLKKRHRLKLRDYIAVTLLYYMFYGIIGVFFIFLGARPGWQTIIVSTVMAIISIVIIRTYFGSQRFNKSTLSLRWAKVSLLLLATLLQAIIQTTIYYLELHSVNNHVAIHQIITYTGVANLALFVGLTPGAIGIRESFLVLSEHLHHISSANIVVANVIDRSVYLLLLLIVFILMIGLHAKDKLLIKSSESTADNQD